MILGIDTSSAQCAAALLCDSGEVFSERRAMDRGHAERLFPMIDAVLAQAGAEYKDVGRVAVCTGPGSFTGLRIGVAAARGIALGRGIPALGVSRFEALAAEVADAVTICLSGRGGTVFWQSFHAGGSADTEPQVCGEADLAAAVPADCARFAGDAAHLLAGAAALLPDGLPDPAIVARLSTGRENAPLPAPLYLRGADADLPREGPPRLLD